MVEDTLRRSGYRTHPEHRRDTSVEGHSEHKVLPRSGLSGNGEKRRIDVKLEGKEIRLIPFNPDFHDEQFMGKLYKWVKSDPSYKHAFRDGFVNWSDFFRFFDKLIHPERVLITIITNTDPAEFAGITWFNIDFPVAWANFMFRTKYGGTRIPQEACRMSIRYVFQIPEVKVILGVTPADNKRAINFVRKRVGFHVMSEEIPYGIDANTASVASYLTRGMMEGVTDGHG